MGSAMHRLYFGDAERKTSLGRDWHPTCLKCSECGRVLSPGQHAEHKGNPYCHTPCYKALFGPSLLGYGSNLASPANFAKKDSVPEFGHDYDDDVYKREIYSNRRSSAATVQRQRQRRSVPSPVVSHHDFSPGAATWSSRSSATCQPFSSSAARSRTTSSPATSSTDTLDSESSETKPNPSIPVDFRGSDLGMNPDVDFVFMDEDQPVVISKEASMKRTAGAKSRSSSMQVISLENSSHSLEENDIIIRKPSQSVYVSKSHRTNVPSFVNPDPVNCSGSPEILQPFDLRPRPAWITKPDLRDILEKVEAFNSHYEGKVHHQMTVDQLPNGEVKVQGPLRVYWGLSRPIQLKQCDDVPAPPIAKWRHSLCASLNDGVLQSSNSSPGKQPIRGDSGMMSPHRLRRGIDDSVLLSPSTADEVVMRRPNIRKFNTVAYRSDVPTKWKRASINGHIFNYDTSVFIPVLGSSTCVIVDSTMTSPVVIETLLDKFKVENSPKEYVLSVVTENGDQTQERLLGESDWPLLERLQMGADDQYAKLFLKERRLEPQVTVPDTVQLPIMEEEEEETLPAEVEQLMILPVAVLKGILIKYKKDEERELHLLRAKYDRVKRKIRQRLEELKTA